MGCAKHFPGHGGTTKDSHFDLPHVKTSREDIIKNELIPFVKASKSRVEFMMMAHLQVDSIDPLLPTSLSKSAYEFLRKETKFTKLIVTDDMEMKAIADRFTTEEAAVMAIEAGADIVEYRSMAEAKKGLSGLKNAIKTKRLLNTDYYEAQSNNQKNYTFIESEKLRLSTPRWEYVTNLLEDFKKEGYENTSTTGKVLQGIFEKNKSMVLGTLPFKKTTNIMSIISRTETLLLAYKRIKKNRGALTKGADVNYNTLKNFDESQRYIYYKKQIFPDGFSLEDIELTGFLILKGKYPWGSSRRIWIDKPGDPEKKRPITIPPFLDRIVQEAIKMVLYSIWEPDFEILNRSFGFRPNKSCHDAIAALKSTKTSGLFTAIEGDIQSAYDNVNKNILIKQLEKKIKDNKFINFMKKRLNYDYVDGKIRQKPSLGIPQGGIDSPYLFNIYLHDLDKIGRAHV
jgi:retron-type reverse transcriptase